MTAPAPHDTGEDAADTIGAGAPALLLPALSSVSARAEMLPLARALAGRLRSTVPDWPGFGDRPRARPELSPDALRRFLDTVLARAAPAPLVGIAAGHAATYLVDAARRHPGRFDRLVLLAPTWRGPLPTMQGASATPLARRARRAIETPLLGDALYRLATSRRMITRMMRAHVYADAEAVTPDLLSAKLAVARQPHARFGTAAFISGGLDPVASRDAFLALFDAGLPPTLLLRPQAAPPKSGAEMDALAATGQVRTVTLPGALAMHEEHPAEAAAAILAFLDA